MKGQLGPEVWGQTVLLAMTEFGRTLRENGSGGTDHGTGGAMLAAGGAVRGGQVLGRWPGLDGGRSLRPARSDADLGRARLGGTGAGAGFMAWTARFLRARCFRACGWRRSRGLIL